MSDILYDLHCHSQCSDGQLSVEDLVNRAAENGVTHLALTDHDTNIGWSRANKVAEELTSKGKFIQIVSGIEFSCQWLGRNIHLVGLNFDPEHPKIIEAVEYQTKARVERAKLIAEKLHKKFNEDIWPDLLERTKEGVPGRPHFAQIMVEKGWVKSIDQAFKKYLGAGKIGDVKTQWPEMSQVVHWVHEAGGLVVMAHPDKYKLTRTKARLLFDAFEGAGGDGIEASTGTMDPNFRPFIEEQIQQRNMLASCGSDFHGPTPWGELGKFKPLPSHLTPVWSRF